MKDIRVFDDFLADPENYRRAALEMEYKTHDFPDVGETWHGIAAPVPADVCLKLARMFPAAVPTLSFFRRSPLGQKEPHYIHTDADMGDWSALLYLNPAPPPDDGTAFWRYKPTGEIENPTPHVRSAEGLTPDPALWARWRLVKAKFNRLVLFPSTYLHSRAIFGNWGAADGATGEDARLIQVTFGKGVI